LVFRKWIGRAEKVLDLPARSRFGEGRAQPLNFVFNPGCPSLTAKEFPDRIFERGEEID
jgi:hypothetical protein